MKKIIAFVLLLCMAFSFASCDGGKKPAGNGDSGSANLKSWAFHSFEKTIVNVAPKGTLKTEYTVYLAKGETEGCQVAVYSDKEIKNVSLTLKSGETELIKPAMFSMNETHKISRKQYTDALIPYYGKRLTVEKKVILPFMIEFTTDENTPAGEYKYVYELVDKSKNVLATYNITVHVWDFELPKEKTFATAVGLGTGWISHFKSGSYEQWYNTVLEHNMSSYQLPYDILDEKANAYMDDPRVTSFEIWIEKNEDGSIKDGEIERITKIYNKLKTNKKWLDKAFFYPLDEPRTPEQLEELKQWEKLLTKHFPEIEICAPYYTNIQVGAGRDQTDEMEAYTDLWCPKLCLWDDVKSYDEFLDYQPSKSFEQRMNEQIAKGDRMWSYVCNDPDDPYSQMFIDTEGVNQRLLFWQMYQRDIEGFLYWAVNFYGYKEGPRPFENGIKNPTIQNPWETTNTKITNGDGLTIYGCGFLFYPGAEIGYGGAVPSIRAKIVRDGVDDIEMFYLAEKYLDKDWIMEKTREGTPTLTTYSSSDKYASLRIEIGNALEAAMKK
ncbi:MAG: DUF4091 domain-containing protein [Clostridia bacterium]|nr:DUF4091 domain-containing protein [Clostridia bacterium]